MSLDTSARRLTAASALTLRGSRPGAPTRAAPRAPPGPAEGGAEGGRRRGGAPARGARQVEGLRPLVPARAPGEGVGPVREGAEGREVAVPQRGRPAGAAHFRLLLELLEPRRQLRG